MVAGTVTTLWLIRHGATTTAPATCCGWSDPGLADPEATGRSMRALASAIGAADRILTSDLERAVATARMLAGSLRAPVRQLRSLREIGFGAWEGLSWAEIAARHPAAHRDHISKWRTAAFPGGESVPMLWRRVARVAGRLPAGCTVVVAHAGSLRALAAAVLGWSVDTAMARPLRYGHAALIRNGACLAWDVSGGDAQPAWRRNS